MINHISLYQAPCLNLHTPPPQKKKSICSSHWNMFVKYKKPSHMLYLFEIQQKTIHESFKYKLTFLLSSI